MPSSVQTQTFFDATECLRHCKTLRDIEACFSQQATDAELSEALRQRLSEFEKLLHELSALGCEKFVAVDLTIVRGLAYYTGFVFELFETENQGRALAGGGRYDQLFEKLTRHPMPAVGFAAGDVTLTDLLNKYHLLPEYKREADVFCVFEETERDCALRCTQVLRHENFSVLYPFGEAKVLSKQLKKAYAEQPRYVLIFTRELSACGTVQVKCLADETTREVMLEEVAEVLRKEWD
ncbi:MAG: ATP phosphoribosyltransferase regulatory subunit [Opitutales bacterium]|nr:ATP phosphoribosyltransferase regulatory subunit [Opitutales bacterium]